MSFALFVFAASVVDDTSVIDDNKTRQASYLCDVRDHSDIEEALRGETRQTSYPCDVRATDTTHLKVLLWSEEEGDGLDIIGGTQRRALRVSGALFVLCALFSYVGMIRTSF